MLYCKWNENECRLDIQRATGSADIQRATGSADIQRATGSADIRNLMSESFRSLPSY
jgi:hypothetical protein